MKNLFLTAIVLFTLISCNNNPRKSLPQTGAFGKTLADTAAMTTEQLMDVMTLTTEMKGNVKGIIDEYCKGEGCWLTLKNSKGDPLMVEIEDKAFVLPYDINGKVAIISGTAITDTTEDGRIEVVMFADGVLIK
ncbi:MAG: DUF4920 domain-containing protein [Bacteroidota bacterium]|jgi:hypothetical protein